MPSATVPGVPYLERRIGLCDRVCKQTQNYLTLPII